MRHGRAALRRHGDFPLGYSQSKLVADLCVDELVRPTRIPPRQSGAARPCSTPPGGARQGPIAGYVLQSAAPTGPSPWAYEGVSSSSVYRTLVSGCEGPSIAVLCSVASRVARETQSSYLRLYHLIRDTVSEREMRTRPNTTLADRLA